MEELRPQMRIDRYELERLLGSGGMGQVWVAIQQGLGRRVALKVMHPSYAMDPMVAARFRQEAQIAASFNHPGIVPVTDFGIYEGRPFLVMDLLEGEPLSQTLTREAPLAPERVAFLATQMLAALEVAHERGVVHRDLKPDNVFLTHTSGVQDVTRLLDFGIARLDKDDGSTKMTRTGQVLGTPSYMAPEQARGRNIDHRVDLYAVGVIMYEALTGRVPFEADNYHQLMFAIVDETPEPLSTLRPDVDAGLIAVIERSMAKSPDARYPDASSMRAALAPFAQVTTLDRTPSVRPSIRDTDPLAATVASGPEYTPAPGLSSNSDMSAPSTNTNIASANTSTADAPASNAASRPSPNSGRWAAFSAAGALVVAMVAGAFALGSQSRSDEVALVAESDSPAPSESPSAAALPTEASGAETAAAMPAQSTEASGGGSASGGVARAEVAEPAVLAIDGAEEAERADAPQAVEAEPSESEEASSEAASSSRRRAGPSRNRGPNGGEIVECGDNGTERELFRVRPRRHVVTVSFAATGRHVPVSPFRRAINELQPEMTECFSGQLINNGQLAEMSVGEDGIARFKSIRQYCPIAPRVVECLRRVLVVDMSSEEHSPGDVRIGFGLNNRR